MGNRKGKKSVEKLSYETCVCKILFKVILHQLLPRLDLNQFFRITHWKTNRLTSLRCKAFPQSISPQR